MKQFTSESQVRHRLIGRHRSANSKPSTQPPPTLPQPAPPQWPIYPSLLLKDKERAQTRARAISVSPDSVSGRVFPPLGQQCVRPLLLALPRQVGA